MPAHSGDCANGAHDDGWQHDEGTHSALELHSIILFVFSSFFSCKSKNAKAKIINKMTTTAPFFILFLGIAGLKI